MKRQFEQRKRIVVYVDVEEYAELERQAGGKSISAYVRKSLLGDNAPSRPRAPKIIKTVEDIPKSVTEPKRKASRSTCAHGTEKGYNCWQCGGAAKTAAEA